MPRIRVLTAVAGDPSWSAGEVVEVDDATAAMWADGERAELLDVEPPRRKGPRGERAVAHPPGETR
jgi:hypothetical protein